MPSSGSVAPNEQFDTPIEQYNYNADNYTTPIEQYNYNADNYTRSRSTPNANERFNYNTDNYSDILYHDTQSLTRLYLARKKMSGGLFST